MVEAVSAAVWPTLFASLAGGVVFAFCLFVLVSPWVGRKLRQFVRGWVAPSTALVGLAILLMDAPEGFTAWAVYVGGFVLIAVSSIYRWGLEEELNRIETMSWIARSYGASSGVEFRWIQLPYFWKSIWGFAGIGAIWLLGDFALAKMVIGGQSTLPLVIEALMGSYRLEAGLSLSGILFALSAAVWILFKGVGRVLD
jgi:ABC-type spermidine/putrescine transport system permease subunit II